MLKIKPCRTDSDFAFALQITKDYLDWLDMDLAFQDIDRELAHFPTMYGPPKGAFLLAWHNTELAGGVGLRWLEANICEMKRLFVYHTFRGRGIGRKLCKALFQEAMKRGYARMRLDTLGRMQTAIRLYESLGFKEIAPYRFNPDRTTKYMELNFQSFR